MRDAPDPTKTTPGEAPTGSPDREALGWRHGPHRLLSPRTPPSSPPRHPATINRVGTSTPGWLPGEYRGPTCRHPLTSPSHPPGPSKRGRERRANADRYRRAPGTRGRRRRGAQLDRAATGRIDIAHPRDVVKVFYELNFRADGQDRLWVKPWAAPNFPDSCFRSCLCCELLIPVLVVDLLRGSVAERRVETLRIVAELDVPCHILPGMFTCRIDSAVHPLNLQ